MEKFLGEGDGQPGLCLENLADRGKVCWAMNRRHRGYGSIGYYVD
jgi:hypothetical protein